MTYPRKRLISLSDTLYYHCISRCVRRAFLCGKDPVTGADFEHRRQWTVERLNELTRIFAIDLCAYAIMNNHYHLVVKVDAMRCEGWTAAEVASRWCQLFTGPQIVHHWLAGAPMSQPEIDIVAGLVAKWRSRLSNLSWFMRCMNEFIARRANLEDQCRGRFWEGRFKSQALLSMRAVLVCMAYVDLNPIRAAISSNPEDSDFTSIQRRIQEPEHHSLLPFSEGSNESYNIPYSFSDYLLLVDSTGRAICAHKRGYIPQDLPPILERLGLEASPTFEYLSKAESMPTAVLGPVGRIRQLACSVGASFVKGSSQMKELFPETS